MSVEIILTFGILTVAVVLFVTELVRVDVAALGVLGALALTGLVRPEQALAAAIMLGVVGSVILFGFALIVLAISIPLLPRLFPF